MTCCVAVLLLVALRPPATFGTPMAVALVDELSAESGSSLEASGRRNRLQLIRIQLRYLSWCAQRWALSPIFSVQEIARASQVIEGLADQESDWEWRERLQDRLIDPLQAFEQASRARLYDSGLRDAQRQRLWTLLDSWRELMAQAERGMASEGPISERWIVWKDRRRRLESIRRAIGQCHRYVTFWEAAQRFNESSIKSLIRLIEEAIRQEPNAAIQAEWQRLIGTRLGPLRSTVSRMASSLDFKSDAHRALELVYQGYREANRIDRIRHGMAQQNASGTQREITTRAAMFDALNRLIMSGMIRLDGASLTTLQYNRLRAQAAIFGWWIPYLPGASESKTQRTPHKHRYAPGMYLSLGFVEPANVAEELVIRDAGVLRQHYHERSILFHPDRSRLPEPVRDYWWSLLQLCYQTIQERQGKLGDAYHPLREEDQWTARSLDALIWQDLPLTQGLQIEEPRE